MQIEERVESAVRRGLAFLDEMVADDGIWPCMRYEDPALAGPSQREAVPFMSALGVLALEGCGAPGAEALRSRTRAWLQRTMEYPGVWRYWYTLPPDVDDTAVCSLAAGVHLWLAFRKNARHLLSNRDGEGRFRTWMYTSDDRSRVTHDVDPVVNANAIAWLGDRPETRGAQRWIERLVEEEREAGRSRWYPEPMDLYVALVRAIDRAKPALARLRPVLAQRIGQRRDERGRFGDVYRTAGALCALDVLEAIGPDEMRPSVEWLLDAQRPDGSWPACLVWQAQPPTIEQSLALAREPIMWFAGEALPTACCIEAMERFLRASARARARRRPDPARR